MDAVTLLTGDHNRVRGLFTQFNEAQERDDTATMTALATRIFQELQIHTTIEEEIFYPAVREIGTDKAEEMMLEAVEEHHVVDLVLAEIPKVDPAAETFEAKMTVLRELIEHHVEEEQEEVFPMAEKRLGKERIDELGERLEERSDALESRAA